MKDFITVLFVLLSLAQAQSNRFSYTLSGPLNWTVTEQTEDAVSGGFYVKEDVGQSESWDFVLGIQTENDALSQKLRIKVPLPFDKTRREPAYAYFQAAETDFTLSHPEFIRSVHTSLFVFDLNDNQANAEFAFGFRNDLCIRGGFSIDLTEDGSDLDLYVSSKNLPDDPYLQLRTAIRKSFNGETYAVKRRIEVGELRLIGAGPQFVQSSPLLGGQKEGVYNDPELYPDPCSEK